MAPGGPQCPYWPVLSDWLNEHHHQAKNNDVSAREYLISNIRGSGGTDKYGDRR